MLALKAALIAGVCLPVLTAAQDAIAATGPSPVVVAGDNHDGVINTAVTAPGASGGGIRPTSVSTNTGGDGASQVTCTWTAESRSSQDFLNFLGGAAGSWYDVRCSDGTVTLADYVPPGSSNVPAPVVLAGTLARSAANSLALPAPQVAHSPSGQGLVGLPTWFWIDPSRWRVLRQRTSAGPVWAEVTATPQSTTWEPGDGSAVLICPGSGTAYDRAQPEASQTSTCSHTYTRSSADQPQQGSNGSDRAFSVRVTVTWQVSWRGSGGSGGVLPVLSRSSSFSLPVAQRQTVVTTGSD